MENRTTFNRTIANRNKPDRAQLQERIPSWGIDLDPARRPAYPKEKTPEHGTGAHWERPEQQLTDKKINISIEHPHITPVFGTSTPPSGLSGVIRNFAYRYSESKMQHWLMLLFADRVNMIEGVVSDLAHGHIPNVISEMGLKSEWKYNRKMTYKRIAMVAAIGGGLFAVRKLLQAIDEGRVSVPLVKSRSGRNARVPMVIPNV